MKTKSCKTLPKTIEEISNGGVYEQRVRCGKANCRCARGETHLAFYFFTRRNGKLTKTYIRKAQFAQFWELANNANLERVSRRTATRSAKSLLRDLRRFLKEKDMLLAELNGDRCNA